MSDGLFFAEKQEDGTYKVLAPLYPDPLADAKAWKAKNPDAYDQMVEWARWDVDRGYRASAKLYIELLRRPHFASLLGFRIERMDRQVLIKNGLAPYLARLIMQENEDLKGKFHTAKVKTDGW